METAILQLQGSGASAEQVVVVNAFDIPKVSYDPVGRKMFADNAPRTLFADAMVGVHGHAHMRCMHDSA